MTTENKGGRPRIYTSPDDFDNMVDSYVVFCVEKEEPITWTGLALYLGFSHRRSIDEYQYYEGFSHSVKRAKTIVENAYEKKLHDAAASGAIFALKNFGWTDKQELTVFDGEAQIDRDEKARVMREEMIKKFSVDKS